MNERLRALLGSEPGVAPAIGPSAVSDIAVRPESHDGVAADEQTTATNGVSIPQQPAEAGRTIGLLMPPDLAATGETAAEPSARLAHESYAEGASMPDESPEAGLAADAVVPQDLETGADPANDVPAKAADAARSASGVAQSRQRTRQPHGAETAGEQSPTKVETTPMTEPAPEAEAAPEASAQQSALDPTSPVGDIRHVIAALRSSSEAEQQTLPASQTAAPATTTPVTLTRPADAPASLVERLIAPIRGNPAVQSDRRTAVAYASRAAATAGPGRFSLPYELRLAVIGAAIVAAALLAGFVVSSLRTPIYAARTDLIFPLNGDFSSGFLRDDRRMLTHVEQLRNWVNLNPIAESEGIELKDLEKELHVSILGGSELIRVEVQDPDGARALSLTSSIVDHYVQFISDNGPSRAKTLLQKDLAAQQDRIKQISARLAELSPVIANAAGDPAGSQRAAQEAGQLNLESASLFKRVGDMQAQLDAIEVQETQQLASPIVAAPHLLPDPVLPRTLYDVALAGAVGLIVAAAVVAYLWWKRAPAGSTNG